MTVAVTGASGVLGSVLVRLLRERGADVVGVARSEGPPGISWRRTDMCDPAAVAQALAGAHTVVHAASAGASDPGAEITFAQNVVDAAREHRLAHLVYVSIVNVGRNTFFPLYAAKAGAENLIAQSGVPFTVQRIAQFHEFMVHIIELTRVGPVAIFPPGAAFQPIAVHAAAEHLAEITLGEPRERAHSLAGPEDLDLRTIFAQYERARGIRTPAITLPLFIPGARAIAHRRQIDPDAERYGPTWAQWLDEHARERDRYAKRRIGVR